MESSRTCPVVLIGRLSDVDAIKFTVKARMVDLKSVHPRGYAGYDRCSSILLADVLDRVHYASMEGRITVTSFLSAFDHRHSLSRTHTSVNIDFRSVAARSFPTGPSLNGDLKNPFRTGH